MNLFNDLSDVFRIQAGCDGDKQKINIKGSLFDCATVKLKELENKPVDIKSKEVKK